MTAPAWKEDFPIAVADEELVTRREFAKSLVWVSCASFAATAALAGHAALTPRGPLPEKRIGGVGDLEVGGARVFHYPTESDPCVLVRLEPARFVAFSQRCTHLGCPVLYRHATRQLHCPCHEGFFDAATGAVISGPPPRPLPAVRIDVRGDELWAVGVTT
jgi:nitrite reductase/ring-hydroxylating ferredoxin subunit